MNKKPLIAITGASSGIGKATAFLFAKKGYPVLLMARRENILSGYDIKEKVCAKVDVRDIDQIKKALSKGEAKYGPVDLIINNAAIMPLNKYVEQPLVDKYKTLDVNIKGVINGMDAVLPKMIKRKTGTIINISSIAARYSFDSHTIVGASKSAVNAITEQVRKENAINNIRFTLIEPAIVNTNALSSTKNPDILALYEEIKTKLNGALDPQDIANLILYVYELPQRVNIKELLITDTGQSL